MGEIETEAGADGASVAKRFEYLGWALFLIATGLLAWIGEHEIWWKVAAAAALGLYVAAGWVLRFKVSLFLVFLAVFFTLWATSEFTPWRIAFLPTLLIAAGAVVLLKALRPERA